MEWLLSIMSMVMCLIILRDQKRTSRLKVLVIANSFPQQNAADRTFYSPPNRPVPPSHPVIPPITYDTPQPKKSGAGRKSHQFENVQRRTYHPEILKCPICQSSLRLRPHLNWRKHIQTLTHQLYVSNRGAYCDACQNDHLTYLSLHAAQLSLPDCTYGLDVIVKIGYLRDYYRLTYPLIGKQLPPHIKVSTRHLANLYKEYLALLACAQRLDLDKLKQAVCEYGGLIYAVDGLEPEGGQPQLWSVREVLTGTLLAAGWVTRVNQDTLVEFLTPVKALNLPLLATLSDKQPALVLALEETWKNTPHQFCQAHYLTNAADPLYKSDQQMKTQLRKQVRAAAGVTMREAQARAQKKPNCQQNPLVITGLAAQPPQELDEIRQLTIENKTQAANDEPNQLLDSHDTLSANLANEQSNERARVSSSQNMTDQLLGTNTNCLLVGDNHLAEPSDADEQKRLLKVPYSSTTLTSDSGAIVVTSCSQTIQSFASIQDDGQFASIADQEQSSSRADTVTVLRVAQLSDDKQVIDKATKSASSDLSSPENFGHAARAIKPRVETQSDRIKEQVPSNQLKQNRSEADQKPKREKVLDVVIAKLAETPVVVFDRAAKKPKVKSLQSSCQKVLDKQDQTDELVAAYADRLRRVLSVSGRKPYKFAGLRLYSDLLILLESLEISLEHLANESRLECFADSIRQALVSFEEKYSTIAEGYSWLLDISSILDSPLPEPEESLDLEFNLSISGAEIEEDLVTVEQRLQRYLDWLKTRTDLNEVLASYRDHLCRLTERYSKGLFNCYDIAGLPRTNNGLESHFGAVRRRTLCTAGPYQAQQMLHEKGAWLLLDVIENEHEQLRSFQKVALDDWRRERERIRQHHSTFTNHRRFRRDPKKYLDKLESQAAEIAAL